MRVFDHPNMHSFECPICHTGEDLPVVLIGIYGTQKEDIMEARQYHLNCIDLVAVDTPYKTLILQEHDLIKKEAPDEVPGV